MANNKNVNKERGTEELREMKNKLFKNVGVIEVVKTETGYKGYYIDDIDINGKRIIDAFENKGITIKVWKNIEDGTYDASLNKDGIEICGGFEDLLSTANVKKLSKYNVFLTDTEKRAFKKLLHKIAEDDRNSSSYHNGIGFTEDNKIFKFTSAVDMRDNTDLSASVLRFDDRTADKKLIDKLGQSRGDLESFRNGVNTLIAPNPYLSLALSINLYGFLQQYLTNAGYTYKRMNLEVNFTGTTKIGKSTMSRLCNMLYGSPDELMVNYAISDFELDNVLANYNIIPTIIDDIAVGVCNDTVKKTVKFFTEKIFRVASGETKKSRVSEERRYYSPMVTSTERSIIKLLSQKSANADGYIRRLLEVRGEQGDYTDSPEHAHKIDEFVASNYGLITEVAEYMSREHITPEVVANQFRNYETQFLNLSILKEKGFADRLALLAISGELINKAFGTEIDVLSMIGAVIKNINIAVEDMENFETDRLGMSTFGRDSAKDICSKLRFYTLTALDKERYTQAIRDNIDCTGFKDASYLYIKGEDALKEEVEFTGNRTDFKCLLNELKAVGVLVPGFDGPAMTAKVVVLGKRSNYYRFDIKKLHELGEAYKYVAEIEEMDEEDVYKYVAELEETEEEF